MDGWDGMGWDGMGWDGMGWDEWLSYAIGLLRAAPVLIKRCKGTPLLNCICCYQWNALVLQNY